MLNPINLRFLPSRTVIVGIYSSEKGEKSVKEYIKAHREWENHMLLDTNWILFKGLYKETVNDALISTYFRRNFDDVLQRFEDDEIKNYNLKLRRKLRKKNNGMEAEGRKLLPYKELEQDYTEKFLNRLVDCLGNYHKYDSTHQFVYDKNIKCSHVVLVIDNSDLALNRHYHKMLSKSIELGNAELHVVADHGEEGDIKGTHIYMSKKQGEMLKSAEIRTDW